MGLDKRNFYCWLKLQPNAHGAGFSGGVGWGWGGGGWGGALTTPSEGLRWWSSYENF